MQCTTQGPSVLCSFLFVDSYKDRPTFYVGLGICEFFGQFL